MRVLRIKGVTNTNTHYFFLSSTCFIQYLRKNTVKVMNLHILINFHFISFSFLSFFLSFSFFFFFFFFFLSFFLLKKREVTNKQTNRHRVFSNAKAGIFFFSLLGINQELNTWFFISTTAMPLESHKFLQLSY